ncbi:MAG TPA: ABC transporter substrate-binding protein [Acidimicrobiales bacterium]
MSLALASVLALATVACGSDDDDGGSAGGASAEPPTERGLIGDQPDAEPTDGGVLNFGVYAETAGLDPTTVNGSGVAGGIELAAIYDTLLRFDPETLEYEPQLAESIEGNEDGSQWTLRLREGVTFSDGTPLDAEAVVFSLQRHVERESRFAGMVGRIERFETPDPRTVVFTLSEPWTTFPFMLAYMPGMIVSPTAVRELGDEEFNRAPVGAGPFEVERYAPGEELVLRARDDYWDGRPHLDGVRFAVLQGADANLEAMESGELQAAFLREPKVIDEARQAGYPGYLNLQNLGAMVLVNHGVRGQDRPTADLRVRQAIAAAVNPEVLNERADQGHGYPTYDVLSEASPYHDQVSSLEYDPDRARQLVEEVKQETGWDGSLELACSNIPSRANWALAVGAQLDAVGFQTTVDTSGTVADLIRRVSVDADFDLACWGFNLDDANPFISLSQHVYSTSRQNVIGYANEELDALVDELRVARGTEEITDILNRVQEVWDETLPTIPTAAVPEFIAWDESVHGVVPTVNSMILLDDAFIAGGD